VLWLFPSQSFANDTRYNAVSLIDFSSQYLQKGLVWDNTALNLDASVDYKNYTVQGQYINSLTDRDAFNGSISYNYSMEFLYLSTGADIFEYELLGETVASIFFEVEGRQEVLGLIPELHFSKSINKSSSDFLNLRLGKEIYSGDFLLNPYAEFAMGSIYSDNFKSSNILLGVDVVTPMGDDLYISPHLAVNFPLGSVKEFDEGADTSIEIGIALRKDF